MLSRLTAAVQQGTRWWKIGVYTGGDNATAQLTKLITLLSMKVLSSNVIVVFHSCSYTPNAGKTVKV